MAKIAVTLRAQASGRDPRAVEAELDASRLTPAALAYVTAMRGDLTDSFLDDAKPRARVRFMIGSVHEAAEILIEDLRQNRFADAWTHGIRKAADAFARVYPDMATDRRDWHEARIGNIGNLPEDAREDAINRFAAQPGLVVYRHFADAEPLVISDVRPKERAITEAKHRFMLRSQGSHYARDFYEAAQAA